MTPSHHTHLSPLDYILALALSYTGLQLRAGGAAARSAVADARGLLIDSLGSRGLVRARAATLAIRALLCALDEVSATNVSALAQGLARAEALTTFRRLLDGDAPADTHAALSAAWRVAPGVDESVALAHAALRLGALYVDGARVCAIGDLAGQRLARELGRADMLGEADAPGPVAASTEAPTSDRRDDITPSGVHRAPRVVAWLLSLSRPGQSWTESRIDDLGDAELVIAGHRRRERREGTRLTVVLAMGDGSRVTASAQVFRGGRWVDADGQAAPVAEGVGAS